MHSWIIRWSLDARPPRDPARQTSRLPMSLPMTFRSLIYPIRLKCLSLSFQRHYPLRKYFCLLFGMWRTLRILKSRFVRVTEEPCVYSILISCFCVFGVYCMSVNLVLDTVHWHAPFDTSRISFFFVFPLVTLTVYTLVDGTG